LLGSFSDQPPIRQQFSTRSSHHAALYSPVTSTLGMRQHPNPDDHLTDDCPFVKCSNCDMFGHTAREYPKKKRDNRLYRRCEQTGYLVADCPAKPRMICHVYKEEGHIAKNCTKYRLYGSEEYRATQYHKRKCNRYGGEGYSKANCTEPMVCRICAEDYEMSKCQFDKGVTTETDYIPTADERSALPKIGGLDVNKAAMAQPPNLYGNPKCKGGPFEIHTRP
jgi:hypothetical protein